MEQLYEEETKDEKEGEDEEDPTETKEQVQQVTPKTPSRRVQKNHPSDQIIRNKDAGVETRRRIRSPGQMHLALTSTIEPTYFEEASKDEFWNKAMDEELDQIEKNDTWELVPRPKDNNVIDTKFRKGSVDNNLYIKVSQDSILLIEVYVDDIIFGSDDDNLSQKFAKDM
jgi:hypothetical protein